MLLWGYFVVTVVSVEIRRESFLWVRGRRERWLVVPYVSMCAHRMSYDSEKLLSEVIIAHSVHAINVTMCRCGESASQVRPNNKNTPVSICSCVWSVGDGLV